MLMVGDKDADEEYDDEEVPSEGKDIKDDNHQELTQMKFKAS
jgi:hypothetical protein